MRRGNKISVAVGLLLALVLVVSAAAPVLAQDNPEAEGPTIESAESSEASEAAGEGADVVEEDGSESTEAEGGNAAGGEIEDADVAEQDAESAPESEAAVATAEDAEEPDFGDVAELDNQLFLPQITGAGSATDDTIGPFEAEAAAGAGGAASNTVSGDFNGDGKDDLAIGVPYEDIGSITNAGAVNVIYGSQDGLYPADQFWSQNSSGVLGVSEAGDLFGFALAVGNFNGDRYDDLAIGVPYEDGTRGVVNVLYGSSSGLTASGDQYWHQDVGGVLGVRETDDKFGYTLAVGNFNGDRYDDLAIGVPEEDIGVRIDAGAVNVLYGSSAKLTATGDQFWNQNTPGILGGSESRDLFGRSLTVGDFDGDRFDDLAIGVPYEDLGSSASKVNAGAVNVIYGSAARLTSAGDQFWSQDTGGVLGFSERGDLFGYSLAAGDFNNNGRDDLAIGVPLEDYGSSSASNRGVVNVLYGASPAGLSATGDQYWNQDVPGIADVGEASDLFGFALAAGDFNSDRRDDLAVGVPYEDFGSIANVGVVQVIKGSSAGLTSSGDQYWSQNTYGIQGGSEAGDRFGWSLFVGDFDRNFADDLAIGVPFEDLGSSASKVNVGAVNVIYGVPLAGLVNLGDQIWHQDSPGILGVAERNDYFGYGR